MVGFEDFVLYHSISWILPFAKCLAQSEVMFLVGRNRLLICKKAACVSFNFLAKYVKVSLMLVMQKLSHFIPFLTG